MRQPTKPAGQSPGPTPEQVRSIVDHVVDGIITIDARGTVTTFNRAAEKLFGYPAAEVIGRNVRLLMPEPYRREHDGYLLNYLRTGQAKIIGIGREVLGRRKDGSVFPMELAISEFQIGEERFFTGIVRDITERKLAEEELREAEERMRSVVDHVVDGIITIDERGDIESVNPAAQKIFGYERAELLGRNVKMLMPEPYQGEHDRYIANYVRTGEAKIIGIGREVIGLRKDGSTFPMELAVSEFHIRSRRYFTGIVRDITERKSLEHALRERLEELAQADRQKNEFLAMLGHELRNPLAPLRNALYLLTRAGSSPTAQRELREMMERQVEHLVRLVDDLLDVSRIVRGKIELRRAPLDLAEAISRAVETAQPMLEAQGQWLEVSLPDAPVRVEGDLMRLAQVTSNLLTNAAKHSEHPGGIELTLERQGGEALISVRDFGAGIAPELLPRVFDLFVQGDSALARSRGGLGIGLTLVKRLVEMHGGEVAAASAGPGQGTTFTVRLPALPEVPLDQGAAPAGDAGISRREAHRRVLVVDDNVDAAESVARVLQFYGHEVRCCFEGRTALDAAERYRPDVVVLDIGLPGMDGYEVARELRARPHFDQTPIVAVTGYGTESDRRRSRAAGFDDHLTKPVDPQALNDFIVRSTAAR